MRQLNFELCCETLEACLAARDGGANRIELCTGLSEGGLTPSYGMIQEAVKCCGLPIHVLIRPRGGNFVYTEPEFDIMAENIRHIKTLRVDGVVLGVLTQERTVDVARTRALVDIARPMQVTFHRAFDETASLANALEDVIAIGCDRVLTSGGQQDVLAGAANLRSLVLQADRRIDVAVGGGLRLQSAASVSRLTGAEHFHGSLRTRIGDGDSTVDVSAIRDMVQRLTQA